MLRAGGRNRCNFFHYKNLEVLQPHRMSRLHLIRMRTLVEESTVSDRNVLRCTIGNSNILKKIVPKKFQRQILNGRQLPLWL